MTEARREHTMAAVLVGTALAVLAIRVAFAFAMELFPDEALYAWMAHAMPFSFCPHPPGTPLLALSGMALFGKSEIGVRFWSILLTTAALIPFYRLACSLGGRRVAFWSTLTLAVMPVYTAFGAILTPDGAQFFLWCCLLWGTLAALETGQMRFWLIAGAVAGTGLYVKYVMVLYYPALVLCMVLAPAWRRHFRRAGVYASVLLAVLVFLPVAAVADHATGWTALRYHLGDRQVFVAPSLRDFALYQGFHLLYYSPVVYVGAIAAMVWSGMRSRRVRDGQSAFVFSFAIAPWLFFGVIAAFTRRTLSREQWDAPAYITAIIALVMMVLSWLDRAPAGSPRSRWLRATVGTAYAIAIGITAAHVLEAATGWLSRAAHARPMYTTMTGWRTMAAAADAELDRLPAGKPRFFCGNAFPVALEYAFYGRNSVPYYTFDNKDNTRYGLQDLLWRGGVSQAHLSREIGHNCVFVSEEYNRRVQSDPKRRAKLGRMFDSVEETSPVLALRHGRETRRFLMYRCTGMNFEPGKWPPESAPVQ